jgi:hypothetical protein
MSVCLRFEREKANWPDDVDMGMERKPGKPVQRVECKAQLQRKGHLKWRCYIMFQPSIVLLVLLLLNNFKRLSSKNVVGDKIAGVNTVMQ